MKCEIQWIDETGKPTPDDNAAVGWAICHTSRGGVVDSCSGPKAICATHLKRLKPRHISWPGTDYEALTTWTFVPFGGEGM